MGKPYSEDLRRSVVQAIESGHSYEETAELWCVSVSSISRFLTCWQKTGSVSPERPLENFEFYRIAPQSGLRTFSLDGPMNGPTTTSSSWTK
jgi:transposase-like protein